jgi:glutamyl-tRNA reductase
MVEDLVIWNQPASRPANTSGGALHWRTCLRQVTFTQARHAPPSDFFSETHQTQVLRGREAHRFLCELICGLHSPMLGETEIMGQFRDFSARADFPRNPWGWFLRRFSQELLTNAKYIRQNYLQHLGCQSYGRLAAARLRGVTDCAVLGAGRLARDVAPWLAAQTRVRVFTRNPANAAELQTKCANLEILPLSAATTWPTDGRLGLVVAAPLSAAEIAQWQGRQTANWAVTLDLRGAAQRDPLAGPGAVIALDEIFAELEQERHKLTRQVAAARQAIARLVNSRPMDAFCRPHGWEDICA